ncbi:anhydro-N-acetylmuramic acid kinase [Motiliproteus sp. SC1-56]|uniref:anhydro-N-acetylmuramic acid kinase n=1 Tax=Motiliproteus sp. SC1-56 TaxID=2799565 RepID=UPI001A901685|nr:anhydro-N-acetylmuramic acid kinase [Motiliproteus sp. SC1-56]
MSSSLYIGLMSGTSLDGIDAALVDVGPNPPELLAHIHQPLPPALKQSLLELTQPSGDGEIDRLGAADVEFSRVQAHAVKNLLEKSGLRADHVAAIGSHGQTIRHRPDAPAPFTLQIGDPNTLAEQTTLTVVCDFRRRDMAAGGQGAPLVPAFHAHCCRSEQFDRVIVNIGGMANLTALPRHPGAELLGFDTGPGNVLMDAWAQRHLNQPYDRDGQWACQGEAIPALLETLLEDPFFAQPPPKSTGRERFHLGWLERHLAGFPELDPVHVQATLLQLTACSISQAIRELPLQCPDIYLCGGGAHNRALVKQIAQQLPGCQVELTSALGLDVDWMEAMAFAWLAMRRLEEKPGNLPGATGARGERILGGVYCA